MSRRPIIGWREKLYLPDLHTPLINTKIDTGARTSALYATNLTFDGNGNVSFRVIYNPNNTTEYTENTVPIYAFYTIRPAPGIEEQRPVIQTTAQIGVKQWTILVTLANRAGMLYSLLLGREATRGHFVIDTYKSYTVKYNG